jgi:uncharacterized Zn-finger protein
MYAVLYIFRRIRQNETYCKICDKHFADNGGFRRHNKIHDGTHFTCEICGKPYVEKFKLLHHIAYKHEGMRWKCAICNKDYATKKYLDDHMKEHKYEFEFSCPLCGKGFACRSRFSQHVKRHSRHKSRNKLLSHVKIEHNDSEEDLKENLEIASFELVNEHGERIEIEIGKVQSIDNVLTEISGEPMHVIDEADIQKTFEAVTGMLELKQDDS